MVALLLVGLMVGAFRDLAVVQGWATGTSWAGRLVDALDGLTAGPAVVAGAVALAWVGLVIVLVSLAPGRRTHLRASTDADLWFSTRAVAALAERTADRVAGVVSTDTPRVGTRRIIVEVVASRDAETVAEQVRSALDAQVAGLTGATIAVRTKEVPR